VLPVRFAAVPLLVCSLLIHENFSCGLLTRSSLNSASCSHHPDVTWPHP